MSGSNDARGTASPTRQELALLDQAMGDVAAGHGRMVLIGGRAGIGKTSLVREFLAMPHTAEVAVGRSDPLPIAPALGHPGWI